VICVVLKFKEDPWYLEVQRDRIKKLYGQDLLVAGYPDSEAPLDIILEYHRDCMHFPLAMPEAARQIILKNPKNLLFFEGDMIPNVKMDLEPTIRQYHGTTWPSVMFTGEADVDANEPWNEWQILNDKFEGFKKMPYTRLSNGFEYVGENAEFLHSQAGSRGHNDLDRMERFKIFSSHHNVDQK
jgi:hypothetical protein